MKDIMWEDVAMTPGIVVTTTIPFLFYYFLKTCSPKTFEESFFLSLVCIASMNISYYTKHSS